MELRKLIEKASSIAGNQSKLAKLLDTDANTITAWKNNRRMCAPEDRGLIASVAGVDPLPEIAEAMIQRWEGTPKADLIRASLLERKDLAEAVRYEPSGSFIVPARNTRRHTKNDGRRLRTVNPKHHPLDARQMAAIPRGQGRH